MSIGPIYWVHNFAGFQVPSSEIDRDIVGSVKVSTVKNARYINDGLHPTCNLSFFN